MYSHDVRSLSITILVTAKIRGAVWKSLDFEVSDDLQAVEALSGTSCVEAGLKRLRPFGGHSGAHLHRAIRLLHEGRQDGCCRVRQRRSRYKTLAHEEYCFGTTLWQEGQTIPARTPYICLLWLSVLVVSHSNTAPTLKSWMPAT